MKSGNTLKFARVIMLIAYLIYVVYRFCYLYCFRVQTVQCLLVKVFYLMPRQNLTCRIDVIILLQPGAGK